jgi:outer membrane protein assembly factor BamB
VALDWASGETMWITPVGEIQPQNIVLDSARNRVYVSGTRSVWALATEDGQILWSNGSERFVRNAHHVYVREDGQVMVALFDDLYIDPATGHLSSSPIQLDSDGYDNAPMLDMQSIRMFPAVQSNTVSSNFASVGNTLYFMDSNARLHFLDLNSGEEMETVQFEPPEETPLLMQSGSIGGSWLSVDGNRIAIYFQDSDQLSAYKINAS